MADLFGAPLGIMAKEESNRATLKSGLDAVKTMGEIAAQPTDLAYKQSLTRTHMAAADEAEASAAAARAAERVQLQFIEARAEAGARGQLVDGAASQGRLATVADLPPGGSVSKASAADELEALADFAKGKMPPMQRAKILEKAAEIRQKEAAAASSEASAGVNQYKQEVARLGIVGNLAGSAALNEANYRAVMMSPQRQLLPKELTGNYRTDAPILRAIEVASQDSIKRADLARKQQDSEATRRLTGANISRVNQTLANLQEQGKQIKLDLKQAEKTGGKYGPAAMEAKRLDAENRKSLIAARNAKNFPPAPLDPEGREFDQVYTARDGKTRAVWSLDPATGKGVWMPYTDTSFGEDAPEDADLMAEEEEE